MEKNINMEHLGVTFNSPLEAGVRAAVVLLFSYPRSYDLQRLVVFDYLLVHSGDAGGPSSLHPRLPLTTSELLVRRKLIERGLLLMISRGLVERVVDERGISYMAGELAETFVSSMTVPYSRALCERGQWAVSSFGEMDDEKLKREVNSLFGRWIEQFQAVQKCMEMGS